MISASDVVTDSVAIRIKSVSLKGENLTVIITLNTKKKKAYNSDIPSPWLNIIVSESAKNKS